MKLETIQKKVSAHIAKAIADGYSTAWAKRPFIGYCKTKGTFGSKNWGINLVTMSGHSYGWWDMLSTINGVVVLNTYYYSPTTCQHIRKAARILDLMHVRYVSIDAPRGLQDLERAKTCVLQKYGEALVAYWHMRKPHKYGLNGAKAQLKALRRIGVKVSESELTAAVNQADIHRSERLARKRREKARQRVLRVVAVATDSTNQIEVA